MPVKGSMANVECTLFLYVSVLKWPTQKYSVYPYMLKHIFMELELASYICS